jgi:hypothetical protein
MFFAKNRISVFFLTLLFLFGFISFCQSTIALAANTAGVQFKNSLHDTGKAAGYSAIAPKEAEAKLTLTVTKIISEVLSFLGVIFLILMIYGGYVWMKARGNEADVKRARDIIIDALIGLIIVAAAYAISYFVISALQTGALAQPFSPTN